MTVAVGYPGTPSTEILEAMSAYRDAVYCEWSPNEKVALEVAAGASLAGARCIVTMKHVGLNVAADPLMTLSYTGTVGGLVLCVADDPGMHSSQNEQDTRHFARFAKVPVLEPADSADASEFMKLALDVSERHRTPVILRTTTRVSHSRGMVETGDRVPSGKPIGFQKCPERFVPIPLWGRGMRVEVEKRHAALRAEAEKTAANRIEWGDRSLGIVAEGIAYQYVRELLPDASVLKIGWAWPFPDALLREFAGGVKELLVAEELDDIMEEHLRSLGIACEGKKYFTPIGEFSPDRIREGLARRAGKPVTPPASLPEAKDLPARPPVLCPGCPHRGLFYALGKFDVVVTGDIGCYSLGVFPPLSRIDTILCMGAGISMAHGMNKAGEPRKVVGIVGDSTFFHSGITGLLDIGYNRSASIIVVVDNRTTAMTGHQDNPGTGRTLSGEETTKASIEEFARACGIPNVRTVNPYETKRTVEVFKEAMASKEPWLIVSSSPCPLREKRKLGATRSVDRTLCTKCRMCLKMGCPAIEWTPEGATVNELLCSGCGLCAGVCPSKAFVIAEKGGCAQ